MSPRRPGVNDHSRRSVAPGSRRVPRWTVPFISDASAFASAAQTSMPLPVIVDSGLGGSFRSNETAANSNQSA